MSIMRNNHGFTLLEILIALFIFSILSLMLSAGLRSVIDAQAGTELSADRLRQLQFATLMFSRDIEQAVVRPILNAEGKEEQSFIGEKANVTFTHAGNASGFTDEGSSQLQRTSYMFANHQWIKIAWDALDKTDKTTKHQRIVLDDIASVTYAYLDDKRQFQTTWPPAHNTQLPLAVRVTITLNDGEALSQLYVLPVQPASKQTASKPES